MDTSKTTHNPNPQEKANCISIFSFWWTLAWFKKGYSKELDTEDLFDPLSTDRSAVLGDRLEKQWKIELRNCEKGKRQPSLLKIIFRTFRFEIFVLFCLEILNECILRLATPILLGALLQYFKPKPMTTYENALIYAGGISMTLAISMITTNQCQFRGKHLGGKMRIAICSVAYRKALRLSKTALGETAPGKIINLMANDVQSFDLFFIFIHRLWSAPVVTLIVGYLMYNQVGYAAFIGIGIMFVVVLFQAYGAKLTLKFRLQTAIKTDERVRLMDEVISGVQLIKMYVWEKPFCTLVELARRLELNVVRKSLYIRGIYMTFILFIMRISLFGTLITLMLTGEKLSADKVFVFATYFAILAHCFCGTFLRGLSETAECLVSIRRLQNFLTLEEFQTTNVITHPLTPSSGSGNSKNHKDEQNETSSVNLDHVTAKWGLHSKETTLRDIHLKVEQGKLYIVIGMVGAGKSSLLSTILGELNLLEGNVRVNGNISYASQDAWIFGSTVRQNILFGQEYDRQRYQSVVKSCDLLKDFKQFPQGDQTIVGERGRSLSGGQKARINLARTVYREADIYILDDPLSAVDAQVGNHLFQECLQNCLKGKTRILATHQLQFIKEADSIVLMDQSRMYQYSDYHNLINAHPQYSWIVAEEKYDDVSVNSTTAEVTVLRRQLSPTIRRLSEASPAYTEEEKEGSLANVIEGTSRGAIKGNIMLRYFRVGSSVFLCTLLIFLFLLAQFLTSLNDYFTSILVQVEESRFYYKDILSHEAQITNLELITNKSSVILEEDKILPIDYYIYIYTALVLSLFVVAIIRSLFFFKTCLKSSQRLHDLIFNALIRTSLHFFHTNPSGRILNRFSKDLGTVDCVLSKSMLDAGQIILNMLGSLTVCCVVSPMLLIPLLFISSIFYWMRRIYLRVSKNINRLEGMTRSPVFTQLNATINGISTIRANGAQKILEKEFDKFQDVHTSSWYMFASSSFAFGFLLDLFCFVFISLVTFSFLILKESFTSGQVGLAISQLIIMTQAMRFGIRQATEVPNQLVSVERVLEYANLTPEANVGDIVSSAKSKKKKPVTSEEKLTLVKPAEDWPTAGSVTFQNVYMRYSDEDVLVLNDLTFTVRPSEKIGIVGRTGAGKSSLIVALFRLAKVEGVIEIDGIDTGRIVLGDLRRHISIIPQDPVLFSGSLRRNLDPFKEFSDEQLWKVLEEVELKDTLMATGHGLDNRVLDRGSNYSVGQRQLVCLARAILKNNRILVLDEATANVDPHTDALIQRTIRTKFAPCTVLTVAHRLNTIIDSDRILVMDRGILQEFDHPHILLQNEYGPFTSLVKETGQAMYEQLCKVAREVYVTKRGEMPQTMDN